MEVNVRILWWSMLYFHQTFWSNSFYGSGEHFLNFFTQNILFTLQNAMNNLWHKLTFHGNLPSFLILRTTGLPSGLLLKFTSSLAEQLSVHLVCVHLWVPLGLTFPQSLWLSVVAEGILAFFLLALSFSPAFTTSLVSFLQVGQYLAEWEEIISEEVYVCEFGYSSLHKKMYWSSYGKHRSV